MKKPAKVQNGSRLVLLSVLPFPLAILSTIAFVLTIGTRYPRDIAPGSSLILPGLVLSIVVMLLVTAHVRRNWIEDAPRRFSLILCAITSLLAWPVWTVGILPSVNGISLGREQVSAMRLVGLSTTRAKSGRRLYYLATLEPGVRSAEIGAGRYFFSKEIYDRWQSRTGREVTVMHASGLLRAQAVLDFR